MLVDSRFKRLLRVEDELEFKQYSGILSIYVDFGYIIY